MKLLAASLILTNLALADDTAIQAKLFCREPVGPAAARTLEMQKTQDEQVAVRISARNLLQGLDTRIRSVEIFFPLSSCKATDYNHWLDGFFYTCAFDGVASIFGANGEVLDILGGPVPLSLHTRVRGAFGIKYYTYELRLTKDGRIFLEDDDFPVSPKNYTQCETLGG